ncbi:MAG: MarR family transcriptional regulator, partial [Clostridia bacterium]|nr:MarR family transcriptional regulator [Clostridia bacterium]
MECYYSEEQVKSILDENLRSNGFTTKVAWNHAHGVDIEAKNDNRTLLIEVKGCGSRQPMRVNYFLSILG